MIERKRFSGKMDLDSAIDFISPAFHKYALNLRFYGTEQGLRAENVKGNTAISINLPSGTNQCVGAHYDSLRKRLYFFNYNSNGRNGIYYYDMTTGLITEVFICFTNSATDILSFNRNYPVHSCAVVYQQTGDGDLLYWTDGLNRPRYLNVGTVATTSPFTEAMINAAKNAPLKVPTAAYGDDAAVNSNSLRKKMFRFKYRWVYKNGERSTWSPISKEPLPVDDDNPTVQNDPTKNNKITVTMYAGGSDFQAIELGVQNSEGAVWGDFQLVQKFDRDDYSISPDAAFQFVFYNDSNYTVLDVEESNLGFDWLPDKANTLELLNGNTIIYGGVTDGYDKLADDEVNVTMSATSIAAPSDYGFAWKWSGQYRFGLVYFDDRGKTNGVVSNAADFSVFTPLYSKAGSVQIPRVDASISHTPPSWAVKYQWVRTPNLIAQKFLYFATNDYQTDSNFIYIGIQSLQTYNEENTGSVLGYEFTQGDRVRVVARYDAVLGFTPYSTQLDLEILGVVDRTMTSPAVDGQFLKCKRPTTFPSSPFQLKMLVEIYTPAVKSPEDLQVYYEWGEQYDVTGGYHMGQIQNQTVSQPATFQWSDGDVYYRTRQFFTVAFVLDIQGLIQDANYSDFFLSKVNSNGRPWVIDEDAEQLYDGSMVRWGQSYSTVNGLNRFYPQNRDFVDLSKGDIRRFKTRDRIMRVFQDRGVGQYGVYSRFIKNNAGGTELITTDEIITKNNIQYYLGEFGLGGYPTSLVSAANRDYFVDPYRGYQIRLSDDGMTPISQLYFGQFYIRDLITPYNKTYIRSDGTNAKIMGAFNYFDEEYICVLQGGANAGREQLPNDVSATIDPYVFSFNEPRNGYTSFFSYTDAEWIVAVQDEIFTFKNGVPYIHNNTTNYCNFYGTQYNAEIDIVFNAEPLMKKSWQAITEVSNTAWEVPLIYTNAVTYGTQRQESKLLTQNFTILEGQYSTAFWRDQKSRGGWINGDQLKGSVAVLKLRKTSASSLVYLTEVSVKFVQSPLNILS